MAKSTERSRQDRQVKSNRLRRNKRNAPLPTTAEGPSEVRIIEYNIHPDFGAEWDWDLTHEEVHEINAFTGKFIASKDRGSLVTEAEEMVHRFPQVAQIKSHLLTVYICAGRKADSDRVRQELLQQHPEYLFAKLSELHRLMDESRHDEVLGRFGCFALVDLLGGRSDVHPNEMLAYSLMSGRYALETHQMDSARSSLEIMESIAPDHEMTKDLRKRIDRHETYDLIHSLERIMTPRTRTKKPKQ